MIDKRKTLYKSEWQLLAKHIKRNCTYGTSQRGLYQKCNMNGLPKGKERKGKEHYCFTLYLHGKIWKMKHRPDNPLLWPDNSHLDNPLAHFAPDISQTRENPPSQDNFHRWPLPLWQLFPPKELELSWVRVVLVGICPSGNCPKGLSRVEFSRGCCPRTGKYLL